MKKITLITLAILTAITSNILAQEQKEHTKKYHTEEDGTIYWNSDMPVYFFISPNEDGSDAVRLQKSNVPKYASPYYFDTEGTNYVRNKWAVDPETKKTVVPNVEVNFEIENDIHAPASKITLAEASKHIKNGDLFFGKGLTADISANDRISGLDKIYFSVNGEDFKEFTAKTVLDKEGEFVLKYYSVDKVGNVEEPNSKIFIVDTTAPNTTIAKEGDLLEDILSPRAKLTLSATDENTSNGLVASTEATTSASTSKTAGVKTTYYQFDEDGNKVYANKLSLWGLKEGEHTIQYYSKDQVNNEEAPKTYQFFLDKTAPQIEAKIVGSQHRKGSKIFFAKSTHLELTATDNKAGVQDIFYSINGDSYVKYEKAFPLEKSQGNAHVKFYAVDKVQNKSTSTNDALNEKLGNLFVDLTAPKVSNQFLGKQFFNRDTMFVTSETKIKLLATDYESGVQKITYKVNNESEKEYSEAFNIPESGVFNVKYYGIDEVDNVTTQDFFFVVDNEAPEVFNHMSMDPIGSQKLMDKEGALEIFPSQTLLYLAATDKKVGTSKIYYSLDGSAEKLYTTPIKVSKKGLRTVTIKAVDYLDNTSEVKTIEFVIQ